MACTNKLHIVFGDVTVGVHGDGFDYIFSYACGGMESLVIDGREWLCRAPGPTYWRALTDNDRGNRFHLKSGMWFAADRFQNCTGVSVSVDGTGMELPIAPGNNRFSGEETADSLLPQQTFPMR